MPVEDGEDGMAGYVIGYYYVVNDEIIDIKGTERRVLSIGSEMDGSPFTYWIEGLDPYMIGSCCYTLCQLVPLIY